MTNPLDELTAHAVDWRSTLRQNNRRTIMVIFLFFAIYAGVGFLLDMFLNAEKFPRAPLADIFHALISLQLIPYVTLVMLAIAGVSLLVAYAFYDKLMLLGTEYHEVLPDNSKSLIEKQLYNVVDEMRIAASLRYMPKVFIIDAEYMNAFASGYSEKSAMVAITRGLMDKLTRDELQAVMAHEISHIRHLDIKLTLTASLLANMTIMVLDFFFYQAIFSGRSRDGEDRGRNQLAIVIIILRYVLPIITTLLLLYLSRKRELMADAGCVELMRTNQPLATALMKISGDYQTNSSRYQAMYQTTAHENVRREAYIFDPTQAGFMNMSSIADLFSTHPSLDTRLKALGFKRKS